MANQGRLDPQQLADDFDRLCELTREHGSYVCALVEMHAEILDAGRGEKVAHETMRALLKIAAGMAHDAAAMEASLQ